MLINLLVTISSSFVNFFNFLLSIVIVHFNWSFLAFKHSWFIILLKLMASLLINLQDIYLALYFLRCLEFFPDIWCMAKLLTLKSMYSEQCVTTCWCYCWRLYSIYWVLNAFVLIGVASKSTVRLHDAEFHVCVKLPIFLGFHRFFSIFINWRKWVVMGFWRIDLNIWIVHHDILFELIFIAVYFMTIQKNIHCYILLPISSFQELFAIKDRVLMKRPT